MACHIELKLILPKYKPIAGTEYFLKIEAVAKKSYNHVPEKHHHLDDELGRRLDELLDRPLHHPAGQPLQVLVRQDDVARPELEQPAQGELASSARNQEEQR